MDSYDLTSNKLRHIEPNFNVKVSLSVLRYVGAWPPRGRYRSLYMLYAIVNFIFVLGIYLLSEIAYIVVVWGDTKKMVSGTFLLMTNAGVGYKMILIFFRQKRIEALLRVMNSEIFSVHNVEHERILTWYSWYGIQDHIRFMSFAVVAVSMLALGSIADAFSGREKRLPMGGWYPYNTDATPMFEITFVQQIIGMIILAVQNIGMDVLVTNFLIVACSQLEILKRNIEAIGHEADNEKLNDKASSNLNSCIEHNKAIIRFQNEIQNIFGGSILLQCLINCAIICVTAFHISQMTDYVIAEMIGNIVYLAGMTYQIFLYCWHGNELTRHSENVALGAYYGNWCKLNERYKSALRIVVIRSHRPLSIKVGGGIITISLETFMSIIRMSYSLFTVLQRTTVG